jgi:hypothetical protein
MFFLEKRAYAPDFNMKSYIYIWFKLNQGTQENKKQKPK